MRMNWEKGEYARNSTKRNTIRPGTARKYKNKSTNEDTNAGEAIKQVLHQLAETEPAEILNHD